MSIPNWLNYLGFTKYDLTQLTRVFSKSVLFLLLSPCYRVKNCWVNQSDLRWHDNFSGRCQLPHPTKNTHRLYPAKLSCGKCHPGLVTSAWTTMESPKRVKNIHYSIHQTFSRPTCISWSSVDVPWYSIDFAGVWNLESLIFLRHLAGFWKHIHPTDATGWYKTHTWCRHYPKETKKHISPGAFADEVATHISGNSSTYYSILFCVSDSRRGSLYYFPKGLWYPCMVYYKFIYPDLPGCHKHQLVTTCRQIYMPYIDPMSLIKSCRSFPGAPPEGRQVKFSARWPLLNWPGATGLSRVGSSEYRQHFPDNMEHAFHSCVNPIHARKPLHIEAWKCWPL